MFRRSEKHKLLSRSCVFLCAMALVLGCAVYPAEPEQTSALPDPVLESTLPQESTLATDDAESDDVCELEVDCCGNLNCAPAPCPVFCL